jgi:Fe-S cluster assembly protein SufD
MAPALPVPTLATPVPAWLQDRRRVAAELVDRTAWPTVDEEAWRYSPIGRLDPASFTAVTVAHAAPPPGCAALLATLPPHAGVVVVVDGQVVHAELDEGLAAKGVVLGPADQDGDALSTHLPAVAEGADLFATAAEAYTPMPAIVVVPDGVIVDLPLVVVQWSEQPDTVSYSRVVVDLGRDAEATVLEVEGAAPVSGVRSSLLDLTVAPAGRLRYLDVQDLPRQQWRIATQRATVDSQASLVAMQVALGGGVARTRSDCRLTGRGATGDLLALYFGTGDQVLDFRTFQHHEAPDTTSNLLFKGAVGDHARSVYTGLIRVHPDGRGTNAFQTNRNLKLSEHAWADSVPNLEIENNDVRCSHASTVGPVDEDQRFYLESRGVPPRVADRLIVGGFFDEVLERLPVPGLLRPVRDRIVERFSEVDDLAIDPVAVTT